MHVSFSKLHGFVRAERAFRRAAEVPVRCFVRYRVRCAMCVQEASKKHAAKIAAAAAERSKKKAALREKVAAAKDWSEEEVRHPALCGGASRCRACRHGCSLALPLWVSANATCGHLRHVDTEPHNSP